MSYKYQKVYDQLKPEIEAAWRRGEHKLPSEPELRQRYMVSISTIRQAVDRLENEGVLRRVQGSGCYINGALFSSDRIVELYFLAFGVSDDSPHFRHFQSMGSPPVLERGFHMSMRLIPSWNASQEQFNEELRRIAASPGIDCVITLADSYTAEMIARIQALGKPVIFVNDFLSRELSELELNHVRGDNRFLASECVNHLEDMGHRKLCAITRSPGIPHISNFLDSAMKSVRHATVEPLIIPDNSFKCGNVGVGAEEARDIAAQLRRYSAAILYSIDTCLFIDTMKKYGLRIPDEISMLSADDNIPSINCVASDFSHFIRTIFELARRLTRSPHNCEKHRLRIPLRIVDRHSVMKPSTRSNPDNMTHAQIVTEQIH